ncbi:forespore regulator of the sigma-K checkpoint [Halobacillus dabanensis]|uniref:Forespore regulator of the sigma-K checkpoint n=1 Tax=Halobacillus dabanensis TaxID=240302 RepID=A0A1I3P6B3_HALDA|nr:BofC C-terminal domain-containing protein [Halobacillus dabanensis]SFJ17074.1 forespore regulator of the sigma-K checkpoint [Halobacillus dabanensis]
MKRWALIVGLAIGFAVISYTIIDQTPPKTVKDNTPQRTIQVKEENAVKTLVKPEPLKLTVILKEHYIDGVMETTRKEETIWSMMDFWASYEDWTLEDQQLDRVVFERKVEDISPLTKQQGYFGLTNDGELAVFQGVPNEGKVMESFKPVPIKPLESKRESELKDGIKIKNYRHFEQVVRQYSEQGEV